MERQLYCEDNGTSGQGPQGRQGLHPSLSNHVRIRRTDPTLMRKNVPSGHHLTIESYILLFVWHHSG